MGAHLVVVPAGSAVVAVQLLVHAKSIVLLGLHALAAFEIFLFLYLIWLD
jgi:hypothetical protein